jgi:hypothetical protein
VEWLENELFVVLCVDFHSKFDLIVAQMRFRRTIDEVLQAKVFANTVSYYIQVIFHFRTSLLLWIRKQVKYRETLHSVSRIMENGWQFITLYLGLLFLKLCGGFPIDLESAGESYCKIA